MLRAEREVGKESKQQKSRDTHLTSGHCSGLVKLVCLCVCVCVCVMPDHRIPNQLCSGRLPSLTQGVVPGRTVDIWPFSPIFWMGLGMRLLLTGAIVVSSGGTITRIHEESIHHRNRYCQSSVGVKNLDLFQCLLPSWIKILKSIQEQHFQSFILLACSFW